jgi:hypothetical protein
LGTTLRNKNLMLEGITGKGKDKAQRGSRGVVLLFL